MATAQVDLPPPAVFAHNESLHAILLPPLATFLAELSAPDQLLKLQDILQRFRTPKSYHRVDVRAVQSSELPPDDERELDRPTARQGDAAGLKSADILGAEKTQENGIGDALKKAQKARWKKERGDPVILPEGCTMEDYLVQHHPTIRLGGSPAHQTTPDVPRDGHATNGDNKGTRGGSPTVEELDTVPSSFHLPPAPRSPDALSLPALTAPCDAINPSLESLDASATAAPQSPVVEHGLPPSGPKRRVRELRIDLRTLDAAALFALETWRRELLGLEKLSMEHPDSIWYKEPTPTPPPPAVVPSSPMPGTNRKRGRPSRSRFSQGAAATAHDDGGDDGGYEETTRSHQTAQRSKDDKDDSTLDSPGAAATASNGAIEEIPDLPEHIADDQSEGESELDQLVDEDEERDPSPDVFLDDGFDRREEDDPDFERPKSPRNGHDEDVNSPDCRATARQTAIGADVSPKEVVDLTLDDSPVKKGSRRSVPSKSRRRTTTTDPNIKDMAFVNLTPAHLLGPSSPVSHSAPKPLPKNLGKRSGGAPRMRKSTQLAMAPRRSLGRPAPSASPVSSVTSSRNCRRLVMQAVVIPSNSRQINKRGRSQLNDVPDDSDDDWVDYGSSSIKRRTPKRPRTSSSRDRYDDRLNDDTYKKYHDDDDDDAPLLLPRQRATKKLRRQQQPGGAMSPRRRITISPEKGSWHGATGEYDDLGARAAMIGEEVDEADEEWGFLRDM